MRRYRTETVPPFMLHAILVAFAGIIAAAGLASSAPSSVKAPTKTHHDTMTAVETDVVIDGSGRSMQPGPSMERCRGL